MSVTSRLAGLLPLAGALVLVAVLGATAPDPDTAPRQWLPVAVGEQGVLRDKAVTVTEVRTADALEQGSQVVTSGGEFVVVGVRAAALVDPVGFARVWLETGDGRRYDPRPEWVSAAPPQTQPGFTAVGSWVFEVPAGRAAGSVLLVENEPREFDGFDRGLRIALDLPAGPPPAGAPRLAEASTRVTR